MKTGTAEHQLGTEAETSLKTAELVLGAPEPGVLPVDAVHRVDFSREAHCLYADLIAGIESRHPIDGGRAKLPYRPRL